MLQDMETLITPYNGAVFYFLEPNFLGREFSGLFSPQSSVLKRGTAYEK